MNKEFLKKILTIQSESFNQWRVFAFIIRHVSKLPNVAYDVIDGNIYITKKTDTKVKHYPCVVAHMDTVHDIAEDLTILSVKSEDDELYSGFNRVTMTQTGIGGDDKVGIFIALSCLEKFDNIKLVFFKDEEVGCNGSYDAWMPFFNDCRFVIQCDRSGSTDFITTACGTKMASKDFIKDAGKIMKKYGYVSNTGSMTDVYALKQMGLGVSACNLSCGYYNPHSNNEYVSLNDVSNCLDLVTDMINNMVTVYKHKKEKETYTYNGSFAGKWADDWDYKPSYTTPVINRGVKDEPDDFEDTCMGCNRTVKDTLEYNSDMNCYL